MIEIKEQTVSKDLKYWCYQGFSHHAVAMTGYDEKCEPVAFVAMNGDDYAGAIVVEPFWGALHVKWLYVGDAYRGQGLANRLMQRAFLFGRESHCSFAFVETMSFQALGFYQKMGFQLEFTRSGHAHGTSFHYLRKDFSEKDNQ